MGWVRAQIGNEPQLVVYFDKVSLGTKLLLENVAIKKPPDLLYPVSCVQVFSCPSVLACVICIVSLVYCLLQYGPPATLYLQLGKAASG